AKTRRQTSLRVSPSLAVEVPPLHGIEKPGAFLRADKARNLGPRVVHFLFVLGYAAVEKFKLFPKVGDADELVGLGLPDPKPSRPPVDHFFGRWGGPVFILILRLHDDHRINKLRALGH